MNNGSMVLSISILVVQRVMKQPVTKAFATAHKESFEGVIALTRLLSNFSLFLFSTLLCIDEEKLFSAL